MGDDELEPPPESTPAEPTPDVAPPTVAVEDAAAESGTSTVRGWLVDIVIGVVIAAVGIGGYSWWSGRDDETPSSTPTPTTAPPPTTRAVADVERPAECSDDEPAARTPTTYAAPGDVVLDPTRTYTATVATSCGDIVIELDAEAAPTSVANFVFLARADFYDGLTFHRVLQDFVVQGGDPAGDGSGGPGYSVAAELPTEPYAVGSVAWARSEADAPGTAGSQFFVVTGEQGSRIGPTYGTLGRVVDGQDVAERIASLGLGDGQIAFPVYILDVTISEA
jgi:cyclophilin family peptidyl-prolyl cis-trans isomerase